MTDKQKIKHEADLRVKLLLFGDKITNICAGDNNPHRQAYFVKLKKDDVNCTDGRGHFWDTRKEVIFKGHNISVEKCKELFKPVWIAQYLKPAADVQVINPAMTDDN